MEREVGETFDFRGVTLEVVKSDSCRGCYFLNTLVNCGDLKTDVIDFCCAFNRTDSKSVIYRIVKEW